ncbi:Eukaryotic translation initiation factor 3 subunit M [Sarcoptes scabiei]|uniref:Eukaryotic translation initiation factor 3 subunit M n=1 Tax=Sarcoptes scabiei TaxID=52283 RepID=A0A131ZZE8_SARSC|nr:Eukaryotic translation initiation factor 3 subunit M [Sarcoptes scabiei]KPM04242.1 eukaryotic translation initiation factor 3 subunit M-like protein [Sarcoptes scabiei]UXI18609.1 Eukaryotic translation initiation factor 4B [Sarcoptes scabiei]
MRAEAFICINEKAQCEELREYMLKLRAPISQSSDANYIIDLQQIISVCDIVFKVEKENEIEMVLNSIVSVLLQVGANQPEASALLASFCDQLTKAPNAKTSATAFRVLQNLFNGFIHTPHRYKVYLTLVKLSEPSGQVRLIYNNLPQFKKWFPVEVFGAEKIQELLRLLYSILQKNKQPDMAAKVMVELLTTYTEENASQARDDAHQCIISAIADPHTFLMDYLLTLKPVKFLEGELIYELLTIFVTENLSSYIDFYKSHASYITDVLNLSHDANMQKMRLLTFMQMAEIKKELSYADIQKELKLTVDQVENFVIDVLKTKLVKAHIDQANQKVIVSSTMHRTFGRAQWKQLLETLKQCSENIAKIQDTLVQYMIAYEQQMHI